MKNTLILIMGTILSGSCNNAHKSVLNGEKSENQIRILSEKLTTLEMNDSLKNFIDFYDDDVISMPEYQPILHGKNEVEAYYREVFQRQQVSSFSRTIDEIISLDSTFIEIGTFEKEYKDFKADTLQIQKGKYWNIWYLQSNSTLKLKGEVFGFFSPIDKPEDLIVRLNVNSQNNSKVRQEEKIPFELRAYDALDEKYVKNGERAMRSDFYTDESKIMPFAHPTLNGKDEIKAYMLQYDTHSKYFWIDSISVYTYAYEYFNDYNSILEYSKFHVKWSTPESSGITEGKGIRIWKRQNDKSLKMFRQIGTHDYIE